MHWSCEEVAYWLTTIGMKKYLAHFIEQFVDGQILLHDLNAQNLVSDLKVKSLHSPKIMRGIKALKARCGPIAAPGTPDPDAVVIDRGHRAPSMMLEMADLVTSCHFGSVNVVAALRAKLSSLESENEAKTKFIEKLNRRIARRNDTIDKLNDAMDRMADSSRTAVSTPNAQRQRAQTVSTAASSPSVHRQSSSVSIASAATLKVFDSDTVISREQKVESIDSAQSDSGSDHENRYKFTAQNGSMSIANGSRLSAVAENEAESKEMDPVIGHSVAPKVESGFIF